MKWWKTKGGIILITLLALIAWIIIAGTIIWPIWGPNSPGYGEDNEPSYETNYRYSRTTPTPYVNHHHELEDTRKSQSGGYGGSNNHYYGSDDYEDDHDYYGDDYDDEDYEDDNFDADDYDETYD